jgi:hypothetical protein
MIALLLLHLAATGLGQPPAKDCLIGGQAHASGDVWVHQAFFNVTCEDGIVKVPHSS